MTTGNDAIISEVAASIFMVEESAYTSETLAAFLTAT
jgi:hypothetical protein